MSAIAPEDMEAVSIIRVDFGPGHPEVTGAVTKDMYPQLCCDIRRQI